MTQSTVFDAGAFPGKNANLRVFDDIAALYDVAMLPLEVLLLQRLRRTLFQGLHGTVLAWAPVSTLPIILPTPAWLAWTKAGTWCAWRQRRPAPVFA